MGSSGGDAAFLQIQDRLIKRFHRLSDPIQPGLDRGIGIEVGHTRNLVVEDRRAVFLGGGHRGRENYLKFGTKC